MNILFCIQTLIEMDNPWLYTNYLTNYFRKYILELRKTNSDIKISILMGEAPSYIYEEIENIDTIIVTQQEMLNYGLFTHREVLREYFRFCHERTDRPQYMDYHVELMKDKISYVPDIIISRDNAPYLEECFPNALMLYTEVGFISRKPFNQTMYFDPVGMNCGSYLHMNWSNIEDSFVWSSECEDLMSSLKTAVRECIMQHNPYTELVDGWKEKYKKMFLLPLQFSGFSNIDAEIDFESQFDALVYVMDNVPEDIGIIVTTHPDYNVLQVGTLRYLRMKYDNFLYHDSFLKYNSSSQYLLGLIDGVINLSSTIGLQTLFWDIPCLSIGKYFASYISRPFNKEASLEPLTEDEKKRNNKVLYWLLTHYIIMPQYLENGEWFLDYLNRMLKEYRSGQMIKLYTYINEPQIIISDMIKGMDIDIPEERANPKSLVYYELLLDASKQYFIGNKLEHKLQHVNKDILIYGKGSLGYLIELEMKGDERFKGYIDKNTVSDYVFQGNELIIITPVQEFKAIKKELERITPAQCVSIEDIIRNDTEVFYGEI